MQECPGDNFWATFVDGELTQDEQSALANHLDTCEVCSELVMELGHGFEVEQEAGFEEPETMLPARYEFRRVLGQGAMGLVVEAWDGSLGRRVAIKMLPSFGTNSREQAEREARMFQEARALAGLSHQNILTIYEVLEYRKTLLLVMAYVDGQTLDLYVKAHQPDWRVLVGWYMALSGALLHAHEKGVIHRDIKPSNIMVNDQQEVVLIDFGLATSPDGLEEGMALTQSGTLLGTPAFMSPEQHMGQPLLPNADLFSLCASMYTSLYGVKPFAGKTPQAVAVRAHEHSFQPPVRGHDVPKEMMRLLKQGMTPDPVKRPVSMAWFIQECERVLAPKRTRWRGVGLVAMVALLFVGGLFWWVDSLNEQTPVIKPIEVTTDDLPHQQELATQASSSAKALAILVTQQAASVAQQNAKRAPRSASVAQNKGEPPRVETSAMSKEELQKKAKDEANLAIEFAYLQQPRRCLELLHPYDEKKVQEKKIVYAKGLCLLADGRCKEGESLVKSYLTNILPEKVVSKNWESVKHLCRPPRERAEQRLLWEVQRLSDVTVMAGLPSNCKAEVRRVVRRITENEEWREYSPGTREMLAKSLDFGSNCFRFRQELPPCELIERVLRLAQEVRDPGGLASKLQAQTLERRQQKYPECVEQ